MLRRHLSCFLASLLLALACAVPPACAQPKGDKNVTNFDGGILQTTDGEIKGGPCFRLKVRVNAPNFFDDLQREDTRSGTLYRRGNDIVTDFPKQLDLTLGISDTPCDLNQAPSTSRVYLTNEMLHTLSLNFYWKRGLELRPVEGIVRKNSQMAPIPWYSRGLEEQLPKRFEWLTDFEVPAEGVPLTDSLVLVVRSQEKRIVARVAVRL